MMKHKVIINTKYGGSIWTEPVKEWFKKHNLEHPKTRHDNKLVECVEELGLEAEDKHGRPIIKEIESDTYFIRDYDGCESVVTPDKLKWIKIED